MSELKHCPFCGGKAELKSHHCCIGTMYDDEDNFFVRCVDCFASCKPIVVKNARYRKTCNEEFKIAEQEAIELWNRRESDEQI